VDIQQLLRISNERSASDLHITVGAPPMLRIDGQLQAHGVMALTPAMTTEMMCQVMTEEQFEKVKRKKELDFAFDLQGVSRFRISAFRQRGCWSLAIRIVPTAIPTIDELGLPQVLRQFAHKSQGLLLITGPTGSGKSTTLASIVDYINQSAKKHVITLEDPIEYMHIHGQSVINQREIGQDTRSFATGLRAALRQDPDVILVGEMRDIETVATAVSAAETGHLVLATLHTIDAPQTINRIVDFFSGNQQQQIRIQLASVLIGVVSQRLLPRESYRGRVLVSEILINTSAVANLIRSDKIHQIRNVMQTGKIHGMQTLDMVLRESLSRGDISERTASEASQSGTDNRV